jgi:inorganic pyrophosphatase
MFFQQLIENGNYCVGLCMLHYKKHPWHGIDPGKDAPHVVNVFVEIVPSDTIKYEIDKISGYLKIDRPQKYSNIVPCLYGFIPQTYCDKEIAQLAGSKSNKTILKGDGDPLDICVLSAYHIPHGNLLLEAIPIGGLCLIDKMEADDKIIAVLKGDEIYGNIRDISELKDSVLKRLEHYFLTYKNLPGQPNSCEISDIYGQAAAFEVIEKSKLDYQNAFVL